MKNANMLDKNQPASATGIGVSLVEKKPILTGNRISIIRSLPKTHYLHFALLNAEEEYRKGIITKDTLLQKSVQYSDLLFKDIDSVVTYLNHKEIVTVIDSVMGSGKTTFVFNLVKEDPHEKYLCVVPTLDECRRYKEELAANKIAIFDPKSYKVKNKDGELLAKRSPKINSLKKLLQSGVNIVTTHAMMSYIDEEVMNLLRCQRYTLIIDEVLDVVKEYNYPPSDWNRILKPPALVTINPENDELNWTDNDYSGKYDDIKNLCNLGSLVVSRTKDGEQPKNLSKSVIFLKFPVRFFFLFKKCYICTYMFDCSWQKLYFDMFGVKYAHMSIKNGRLSVWEPVSDIIARTHFQELINIYEGDLNAVGDPKTYVNTGKGRPSQPLCSTWYKNNPEMLQIIKKNYWNWFNNKVHKETSSCFWTIFDKYRSPATYKGFKKSFLACNSKGTNAYRDVENLIYLINFYPPTNLVRFFDNYGLSVDQNKWALSELLQWIWRSRIRNVSDPDEKRRINIYIPSTRMRSLLKEYLLVKQT